MEKPNHIGVCKGVGDNDGYYVITAEYADGYLVLASYKYLANAKKALPKIKRDLAKGQRNDLR